MKISLAFPILLHPIALVLAIPIPPVNQHPDACYGIPLSSCQQTPQWQPDHPPQNQYPARPVPTVLPGYPVPGYPYPVPGYPYPVPGYPVHGYPDPLQWQHYSRQQDQCPARNVIPINSVQTLRQLRYNRQQDQYHTRPVNPVNPACPVRTVSQQQHGGRVFTPTEVSLEEIEPGMVLSIPRGRVFAGQNVYRKVIIIDKDSENLKVASISQRKYTDRQWRPARLYQPQLSGFVCVDPPAKVPITSMTAEKYSLMAAPLTKKGLDHLRQTIKKVQEEEVVVDTGGTPVSLDAIKPGMILSVRTGSPKPGKFIVLERLDNKKLWIVHISRLRNPFSEPVHKYSDMEGYVHCGEPEEISESKVSEGKPSIIRTLTDKKLCKLLEHIKWQQTRKQTYQLCED